MLPLWMHTAWLLTLTWSKLPNEVDALKYACERMQVLYMACDELLFVPTFCSVRHLLMEQSNLDPVIMTLSGLPVLETLSLIQIDAEFPHVR